MNKPQSKPNRLQVNVDDNTLEKINNYRFNNRINSQSTAIDTLIQVSLQIIDKDKSKKFKDNKGQKEIGTLPQFLLTQSGTLLIQGLNPTNLDTYLDTLVLQ